MVHTKIEQAQGQYEHDTATDIQAATQRLIDMPWQVLETLDTLALKLSDRYALMAERDPARAHAKCVRKVVAAYRGAERYFTDAHAAMAVHYYRQRSSESEADPWRSKFDVMLRHWSMDQPTTSLESGHYNAAMHGQAGRFSGLLMTLYDVGLPEGFYHYSPRVREDYDHIAAQRPFVDALYRTILPEEGDFNRHNTTSLSLDTLVIFDNIYAITDLFVAAQIAYADAGYAFTPEEMGALVRAQADTFAVPTAITRQRRKDISPPLMLIEAGERSLYAPDGHDLDRVSQLFFVDEHGLLRYRDPVLAAGRRLKGRGNCPAQHGYIIRHPEIAQGLAAFYEDLGLQRTPGVLDLADLTVMLASFAAEHTLFVPTPDTPERIRRGQKPGRFEYRPVARTVDVTTWR